MLNTTDADDSHSEAVASFYDLVQVDPDGAGIKAVNFAGNMNRLVGRGQAKPRRLAYSMSERGGLPAIRTEGIGLVRLGRAFQLAQEIQNIGKWNDDINADPKNRPVLCAEDVLRGYRIDVMDETAAPGVWRSLCQRAGKYELPGGTLLDLPPDEGYVKAGSASSKDAANSDLYYHESLFKWAGWSLCAPRPGRTVRAERQPGSLGQDEIVEFRGSQAIPGVNLQVNFVALPGSLPRLRFGHTYRMRARTVDLAGNSLPLTGVDSAHASRPITYSRFEPVDAPTLVPRSRFTEGESLERMVIRSNYNQTTAEYIGSQPVQDALKNKKHVYVVSNDRHIAPPKTAQLMAETHGLFDPAIGKGKDAAARERFYQIAVKEAGTFQDTTIVNIDDPKNPIAVTGVEIVSPNGVPLPVPGKPLNQGQYVIHKEDKLLLPYLADPIGRGAALRGIPGIEAVAGLPGAEIAKTAQNITVLKLSFDMKWPQAAPFRIEIRERPGKMEGTNCQETFTDKGAPKWDASNRVLTVFLGKAQVAKIRYSCYLDAGDVKLMGLWRWLQGSAKLPEFEKFAQAGVHWMVSPYRELVLVHAVQQPLCEPALLNLSPSRNLGDTHASLRVRMNLSVKSTGKLDVLAKWNEPVDELADAGPKIVGGQGLVVELQVDENSPDLQTEEVTPLMHHQFGDTKHRVVNYYLKGTTRFREYLPPEITEDPANITRQGPVLTRSIPSSARPAAPKVLYVLPTFGWSRQPTQDGFISKRSGNGLRVYMDRPWYSSGDGELLGVVLREPNQTIPEKDPLKPYVTQWGKDPIYGSPDPKPQPLVTDFPAAVKSQLGLTLKEMTLKETPAGTVSVAGHAVHYDSTRQLWYSEIQINAGASYYPFVRLALARYQPDSIQNAHLSLVVLTDFAQLTPDRTVNVTISADKKVLTVKVFGIVPSETGVTQGLKTDPVPIQIPGLPPPPPPPPPNFGRNSIEVRVEMRDPQNPTDLGWIPAPNVTVQTFQPPIVVAPNAPPPPIWNGSVTMPEPIGTKKYRLVIKEFEKFYQDAPDKFLGKEITTRLVYADVIEL